MLVSPAELFGDGVFETIHLRPSGPWLLGAHLDRLARSAELLELDLPPRAEIEDRVAAAVEGFAAASDRFASAPFAAREAALRIIRTRESLHVTVGDIPEAVRRERRDGVRVISADLGYAVGRPPPWSIMGAKSLSYGPNFAARRWARRHGADDLLWFSTEGYALEATTASLVWLDGATLCTVPAGKAGILPGITATHLLATAALPATTALLTTAAGAGLCSAERMITADELAGADALWLASSLRGLAEVVELDGGRRPRSPLTPRLHELLGYETD